MDMRIGGSAGQATALYNSAIFQRVQTIMLATAVATAFAIGSLVWYAGWIPVAETQPGGVFESAKAWPFFAVCHVGLVVLLYLRFRAR